MSSHPIRSRWLLAPALLLAASASAMASGHRVHIAEDASAIIPVMNISPQVFPVATNSTAVLSVTNGNTASAGILSTGDTFTFDFPDQGVDVGGPAQLTVNSPAISPFAWQVQVAQGGKANLKYTGPSTQFGPRDLITCKVKLKSGVQQMQGQAQFDAPDNRHYADPPQLCCPICTTADYPTQQGPPVLGGGGQQGLPGSPGPIGPAGPPGPAGVGKKLYCTYANGLGTTWYTQTSQWQQLGDQMSANLDLPDEGEVAINYTAVGTTTQQGVPVVLRCTVDGTPVPGGACGINGTPNSWQTLSNICVVKLPPGKHKIALEYCCQVQGATCYIRNPTFYAMGGME